MSVEKLRSGVKRGRPRGTYFQRCSISIKPDIIYEAAFENLRHNHYFFEDAKTISKIISALVYDMVKRFEDDDTDYILNLKKRYEEIIDGKVDIKKKIFL